MATMNKLYRQQYRINNKIHQLTTPKFSSKEDIEANKNYLRDFYLKDFKYISPDVVRVKSIKRDNTDKRKGVNGNLNCRFLLKIWMKQVMDGLKQFLYEGSLHGVKYIFEPTFSRKERATWVVIVVISIAVCTGIIIQLFSKSTSTPFVNVIDSLPTPVWAVPFPSVVLCPHLHVQLSYANVTELDSLHQFFASRICPQMFSNNEARDKRLSPEENKKLQEFIVKGSPKCTDVVKTCYWRGTNQQVKWMSTECCENYFKPLFTNYGLCFTFNGLPLNGLTNETIPWQKSFSQHVATGNLQWDLDAGYPKVFPPDPTTLPFRVMASGESNGLGVELYLNTSEHQFACDGNNLGFNLLISSPTDHVYTSTVLRLPMDRMTAIEVYPITYKTDNNLKQLSPERRQCFFQNERQLVYYKFYTDSNCKHDLLIREAVRVCNCVLFNWPRKFIWEPICSTALDFQCIEDVKAKVEEQLMYAYFADSEEQRGPRLESTWLSCHPSCNDVLYSSQVFYSDLIKDPVEASPKWGDPNIKQKNEWEKNIRGMIVRTSSVVRTDGGVVKYLSPDRPWLLIRGEITRINVHFYDDMFLGQHRHAQYDDYYFVGAIGGLLSLFLGFSIISVAELVYFVILRPLHAVLKEIICGFR